MNKVLHHKLLLLIVFNILFFIRCSNQSTEEPMADKEFPLEKLNELMLKELNENRIVYFGDGWHGHAAYYRKVTGFLNYWLNELQNNTGDSVSDTPNAPVKLVLFLEHDPVTQQGYEHFFSTGNLIPYFSTEYEKLICNWDFATTDNIEFLYGLKEIKERADNLNTKPHINTEFKILGAEGIPPYKLHECSPGEFVKLRDNFFINDRDKISSQNIIDFLDKNPDYKALIFYGTAHLMRGKVDKSEWPTNTTEKSPGYFNVHYLDQHFGRDNVCVFFTYNYYMPKSYHIIKYKPGLKSADYNVLIKPVPTYVCPLSLVKSKLTLQTEFEVFKKHFQNIDFDLKDYRYKFLECFTSRFFNTYINQNKELISEMKRINMSFMQTNNIDSVIGDYFTIGENMINEFNAVSNITGIDKWIVSEYIKYYPSYIILLRKFLASFPDYKKYIHELNSPEENINSGLQLTGNEISYLTDKNNELTEYLLINLLWIATPEEKNEAIKQLSQLTALNYKTAKEWKDYWIEKTVNMK